VKILDAVRKTFILIYFILVFYVLISNWVYIIVRQVKAEQWKVPLDVYQVKTPDTEEASIYPSSNMFDANSRIIAAHARTMHDTHGRHGSTYMEYCM